MDSSPLRPTLFTVPLGRPFLSALAEAILDGDLPRNGGVAPSPIALSQITVLLPTRRAARALADAFLDVTGGSAMLLPRIRPISEGQEDLELLTAAPSSAEFSNLNLAPSVSEIERRLVLTELVMRWSRALRGGTERSIEPFAAAGASTPAQAANLAAELAQLMDMVETEGVSLSGLERLVPEDYSSHWAQTLEFLRIVVEMWPAYLAEAKKLTPAERRNQVIVAEATRLAARTSTAPLIVAGVTGSIPATVALMKAVGSVENGAIVLPAFDSSLDSEAIAEIAKAHPEHPQFGLAKLLLSLGIWPEDVSLLSGKSSSKQLIARQRLVSAAMRPAPKLEEWQSFVANTTQEELAQATLGVNLIETPTADDEAETVVLLLRNAVETPGKTAALISPDRWLARRVVNRLETMGIAVDDSAGKPLAKTPPGAFLILVMDAFASEFAPIALMALLKHPLMRMGRSVPEIRRAARALELIAFRSPYLGRGLEGVLKALDAADDDIKAERRRPRAVRRLRDEDRLSARTLVEELGVLYGPFLSTATSSRAPTLKAWARAHMEVAEALARINAQPICDGQAASTTAETVQLEVPSPLWAGEAGEAALRFFVEVLDEGLSTPALTASDYPELYKSLTASINVRPRLPAHPRISIWGPFEARLQQPDLIVLGAMNDGAWPAAADPGAWLNRPMRASLGLPLPEEKIGYTAHDFTSSLGAEQVYLTRAAKMDGVPTVPSRWVMRLLALLDGCKEKTGKTARQLLAPDQPWLAWARARDKVETFAPVRAPSPRPPVAWRPRKLPVTAIERWIANPYSIYAQHILRLEKLDAIGGEPGASLKGQIIHEALNRFTVKYPRALPDNAVGRLLEEAQNVMAAYAAHPRVAAFWLPRFERFAQWFAETEAMRRDGVVETITEVEGRIVLAAPAGAFTLTARADRIDLGSNRHAITDYKTGRAPNDKRVLLGEAPQLPLEAAIALDGGFVGVTPPSSILLSYIRVSGGEPPGEFHTVATEDARALANQTRLGLERLIASFDDQSTPYLAVRRQAFAESYDYDDYAHLARVAEWSLGADGGDEA
jgi:ATP-dependent helicase/nuclease subunit B